MLPRLRSTADSRMVAAGLLGVCRKLLFNGDGDSMYHEEIILEIGKHHEDTSSHRTITLEVIKL